jgi:hypothetical protein
MAKATFVSGPKHRRVTAPATSVKFRQTESYTTFDLGFPQRCQQRFVFCDVRLCGWKSSSRNFEGTVIILQIADYLPLDMV